MEQVVEGKGKTSIKKDNEDARSNQIKLCIHIVYMDDTS